MVLCRAAPSPLPLIPEYLYEAEQYLNMIKMSDKALKELVHYFEKVDESTVIVFFGDHQPDLDETFYNRLLHTDIQ